MQKTRSLRRALALPLTALPLLVLPAALSGCGFQPLYGEQKGETTPEVELKRVYVANIPERSGQQLRLALQQNMAGDGPEDPDGYTLIVQPSFGQESIDIHSDNTSGRVRMNAHAHWQLLTVEQYPKLLAQGDASTMDGYTSTYEQYFAQTLNSETAIGRVAQTLAEQVTQQVATWFRTHTAPSRRRDQGPAAYYPTPNAIPESEKQAPMEQEGADAIPDMATGRNAPNAGSL
ncbi:LPS assembly lipoprotein LptE [Acetobacter tropicalis]|uniref:Lipoprotein n=1 Tax=Acetobacter tropicalis NBRC 101654 TaxID=749388 RepID=F7VCD8_9PROT|nr:MULTISPECIES: LPS assembly lipoprotein LptE [Acetobacter]MCG4254001.1 hypothetical protein [Acetobacter senegalensis]MCG4260720.1 hypothetical protein [Acetobacter senegalensis]MCP1194370.1 LPS assembly lipoprotein LptE [Acetobacter senegalensis]GAA08033.1 hypothetical protein ATPR_1037 [Acetobacter tropicalis NBRC 101654]